MAKISGVYIIRNKVNGKPYVGSSLDIKKRWQQHVLMLDKNKHHSRYLQNSWNKHGAKSFKFSILDRVPKDKLAEREQYWIDKLQSASIGYNTLPNAYSNVGYVPSASTRAIWSKQRKGKMSGPQNPWFGKKHSKKTRKLISRKTKEWSREYTPIRKERTYITNSCLTCKTNFRGPQSVLNNRKFCSTKCFHANLDMIEKRSMLGKKRSKDPLVRNKLKDIAKLARFAFPNNTPNGMLGKKHSMEVRERMRNSHLGKKQTPEHIKNAADAHRGMKWTEKQKRNHSKAQKLRFIKHPVSEETRRKLSLAVKEIWKRRKK